MSSQALPTRLITAAGLLLAALLTMTAAPALAHDELIGSNPAAGSTVDRLPAELTLTFSGVLLAEPEATEVVVTDAAGTDLTGGDPVVDGTRLTQPLSGDATGEVTVIWRVVSSDGHPISDSFAFHVGSAVAPGETGTPLPGPPMQATDLSWIWIVLGVVAVGLGGALVAILVARASGPREG